VDDEAALGNPEERERRETEREKRQREERERVRREKKKMKRGETKKPFKRLFYKATPIFDRYWVYIYFFTKISHSKIDLEKVTVFQTN